jgi:hypothetical protein
MKTEYTSRQRKIYNDYNVHSTESLLEIVNNRDEYIPEVIEIINDILSERNAIFHSTVQETYYNQSKSIASTVNTEDEAFSEEEKRKNDEAIKAFIEEFSEKSESDLSNIITRHNSYHLEAVKAALIVSVDKGLISYDLKELLLKQIKENITSGTRRYKQKKWEADNAFTGYVSKYTDDEIYNIIEDPKGIVIDVYHAFLLTARERELISEDDFAEYYKIAKAAVRTEAEIERDEFYEEFVDSDSTIEVSETEVEAEAEKYWICPSCNEMVGMEFGICWKCQTEIPETIEHPAREEIIKEIKIRKSIDPVKSGSIAIACGLVAGLIYFSGDHFHYYRIFVCAILILAGVGLVIFGLFFKSKDTD